jgi:hypothetical protein
MLRNKPKSLVILGILTILNTSLALFSGLVNLVSGPPSADQIRKENLEMAKSIVDFKKLDPPPEALELVEKIQQISVAVNDNFLFFTSVSALFSLIGFLSVIFMFRQKIYGFHAYIVYSLLSSTSIYLILSPSEVPTPLIILNLLIAGLFIYLYSKNLAWIKNDTLPSNDFDL